MEEQVKQEAFLKKHYDLAQRAYDWDNVARKELHRLAVEEGIAAPDSEWHPFVKQLQPLWEDLKQLLDPMQAVRQAMLLVVQKRGEQMADLEGNSRENVDYVSSAASCLVFDKPGEAYRLDQLAEAGAWILAEIEWIHQRQKGVQGMDDMIRTAISKK